ncbi:MAG: N-acetyltransferase [Melioribacteraceae bacterium]|nr:N-acetyltransferase [Melioribacteraceae bacterium]
MVREVERKDAKAITDIYNYYIENTIITFEEEVITADEINIRIKKVLDSGLPWLVAVDNDEVVGYAYASKWKERYSYRFAAETTIYLLPSAKEKGYGSKLYRTLFEKLAMTNIHIALGCISLPNDASIKLHEKFGMKKVAHFNEVGYKFDKWIDVGYWQKVFK